MKLKFTIQLLFLANVIIGQIAGNVNYQNPVQFPNSNININFTSNQDVFLSVKGLNNVIADTYVAVFSVTQVGKTTEEVNQLIDTRIKRVEDAISKNKEASMFVDMISFVPKYEYDVEKKIFSRDTYNEIPIGFELKKNLHIKYKDVKTLHEVLLICAKSEIYDLVKVDYTSETLSDEKEELVTNSMALLKEKVKRYEDVLNIDLDTLDKNLAEGFIIYYPIEKYKSYQAYSSQKPKSKNSKVKEIDKGKTHYYQPIINKEFDFVINPTIVEPVIQVLYEVKLRIKKEPKKVIENKYLLISPDGSIKNIDLNK